MKKFLAVFVFSLALLFESVVPAYAANTLSMSNGTLLAKPVVAVASKSANVAQGDAAIVIQRADQLVAVRLASLSQLSTRVQNDKRLSSDEKTSLNTDIQNDISGLTALKTKIDAETDATTARTEAKTIISDYKVFAIFEPKMRMLIILNNLQKPITTIQGMIPQIQVLIDSLQSQGKDTTALSSTLTDINIQLSTINSTITADITTLEAVTPQSTDYQTTFTKVRRDIDTVRGTDFTKIRTDIAQLRAAFKSLNSTINTTSVKPASASAEASNSGIVPTSATPNTLR